MIYILCQHYLLFYLDKASTLELTIVERNKEILELKRGNEQFKGENAILKQDIIKLKENLAATNTVRIF